MQTLEAIAKRKSTRDFDPSRAVPDEVVDTIEGGLSGPDRRESEGVPSPDGVPQPEHPR
ncbi:MAG: hypothetical protein LUG64_00755 [Clostridiales bacterium]|nr:hypothetical protein [Clostridiales bacterium]